MRERISLNAGWQFRKGDPEETGASLTYTKLKPWMLPTANAFREIPPLPRPEGGAPGETLACVQPDFDDKEWRTLNLPHEGAFQQELPGETGKLPWSGIAWYRKTIDLPASDRGRMISLEIDGAMSHSSVWCNGHFVGGWPCGYASYHLDLTPYLKPGDSNTLAIRLNNPEHSSRWYPGGGIYRNVWLTKTAPIHVKQWGTFVTTSNVSKDSATIDISTQVSNGSNTPAEVQVITHITNQQDGVVVTSSAPVALTLTPGGTSTVKDKITIPEPQLWDTQTPNLYLAVVVIQQDGQILDTHETPFGVRKAEFIANDGFHLNGKRVPLQGVCLHHDLGAIGAAFNTRAAERQLQILKEMGVNAIRTSHNPPASELLDLCDRMGLLVVDEFSDCWKLPKRSNDYSELFPDWSEADLRALVRRDRNHPSVILWSIGNEINEQIEPEGPALGKELSRVVHEEDPTRLTTIGVNSPEPSRNGFQTSVDVFGFNYHPSEYVKFHAANPETPMIGSETASTVSSRGEYFFPVSDNKAEGKSDFHISSYDLCAPSWACAPDWEFQHLDENPFVAREFVWTGFDYLGEPTPYSSDSTILLNYHTPEAKAKAEAELKALGKIRIPSRSSYFGILDLAGFKKDRFYLYQARWRPALPMAHILPHWNWPERVGEVTPIHVYTSGDEAELFLNGQSLGRKVRCRFDYRLRWDDVIYHPGELKVVAYKGGRPWATDLVKTTGPATQLILTPDRAMIQADGYDLSFVTVTVADQEGLLVPRSKPMLKLTITGPGEIVATDNGDPTDHTSFQSTERAAFNGLALVVIRAKPGKTELITLRVDASGLAGAVTTITPGRSGDRA